MASTKPKISLKLLIDKNGKRVLFAEAGKDLVDFLFTLLALPIGTVIRLLTKKSMVGCLANLYESVENLNHDFLQPNWTKDVLLKPKSSFHLSPQVQLLPFTESPASAPRMVPVTLYKCSRCASPYLSTTSSSSCRNCVTYYTSSMSVAVTYYVPETQADGVKAPAASGDEGGFVKGVVTYMVMDDLVVTPMSTISSITMLNKFNIKDIGALEEKVVEVGMNEGLLLLKYALSTEAVLTNVFLGESANLGTCFHPPSI